MVKDADVFHKQVILLFYVFGNFLTKCISEPFYY
jgi:hypothetical protein